MGRSPRRSNTKPWGCAVLENFCEETRPGWRADDLLTRYGRWATSRSRGARTWQCRGPLFAPAVGDDDARRAPAPVALAAADAVAVQRALLRVPHRERTVLHVLYVPQRLRWPLNCGCWPSRRGTAGQTRSRPAHVRKRLSGCRRRCSCCIMPAP